MKEYKRIAIKIGSNVLARRDGTLDITRMSALVDQVAELRRNGMDVILITSGAVASGRNSTPYRHASCFQRWDRQSSSTATTNFSATTA